MQKDVIDVAELTSNLGSLTAAFVHVLPQLSSSDER